MSAVTNSLSRQNHTFLYEKIQFAGTVNSVAGTPFDFRTPKAIGKDLGVENEQLKIITAMIIAL